MKIPTTWLIGVAAAALSVPLQGQQVIATCGTEYQHVAGSIAFSIGQPLIHTVSNGTEVLTQGFHQPWNILTAQVNDNSAGVDIRIYPNPARAQLTVEHRGMLNGHIWELSDALGRLIKKGLLGAERTPVDVSEHGAGTYLLRIIAPAGVSVRIFQLIVAN